MKIRNIQTLFLAPEKQKADSEPTNKTINAGNISASNVLHLPGHEVKVEILRENEREQTVEIKIETFSKKGMGYVC